MSEPIAERRRTGPEKPITIRGVTYPSRKAAAEALGVHTRTIYAAARVGALESVGLQVDRPPRLSDMPVTIRGVTYPSRKAAAEALGVASQTIKRAERNGVLEHTDFGRIPVTIKGVTYRSISEAGRQTGFSRDKILRLAGRKS